MALTTVGCNLIASALLGDAVYAILNNANAAIGVGDSATGFNVAQVELVAETTPGNAIRKGMNSTYPIRNPDNDGSLNLTRYQSTYGTSEGNFNWNEWGIFNNSTGSAGQMLCRVVENLGTKTNASQWVFEVDITVATS